MGNVFSAMSTEDIQDEAYGSRHRSAISVDCISAASYVLGNSGRITICMMVENIRYAVRLRHRLP